MNEILSSTILLFLIIDPLGNLPIFMSILKHLNPKRRCIIIIREMLIALTLMLTFLFTGESILIFLNLRSESVLISGGIVLFLIAVKMLFPSLGGNNMEISYKEEPFLVPLAVPLVAGPSLLATLILLAHQYLSKIRILIFSLLIAWSLSVIMLLLSNIFLYILGERGITALERLMGLLLVMISVQMFLNGIKSFFINF